jgi:Domain of unknown function (DUF1772)
MIQALQFVAAFCIAIFAGAALYINVVEHPARMHGDTRSALMQWAPSYKRATRMQVPLAVIGLITAIAVWLLGASGWWLVAGLLIGAVVLFTLVGIMPTNHRLLATDPEAASAKARVLLERWNKLHAVRTALSLVAFALLLWQLCVA